MIKSKKPLIMALGRTLAISAIIDDEPNEPEVSDVVNLAKRYMEGENKEKIIPNDLIRSILFHTLIYGGVQLIYIKKKPIMPLSRYLPDIRLDVITCNSHKSNYLTYDETILDLWVTLINGKENSFLEEMSKYCLIFPKGYRIVKGNRELLPVGLLYTNE